MSCDILIDLIDEDPTQPRKRFDDSKLRELADSMKANGLIVPILVRPVDDRYLIVHGERRQRAAKLLDWATIPAEVREIDTEAARWVALVENIQRADLSPIEEATAYRAMLDNGITQTTLGERIGKRQSYIAQKLRLLKLPDTVQEAIANGAISEGHARQLLRLKDSAAQAKYCKEAIAKGLSVAALKEAVDSKLLADEAEAFLQSDDARILPADSGTVSAWGKYIQVLDSIPPHELPDLEEYKQTINGLSDEIYNACVIAYLMRYLPSRIAEFKIRFVTIPDKLTLAEQASARKTLSSDAAKLVGYGAELRLRSDRQLGFLLQSQKETANPV